MRVGEIGGCGMIHSYCNYGIYNEYTSQCLEEGNSVDRISYWDNGKRVVLKDVQVQSIDKYEVTFALEDFEEITIPIEEIEDWD